MYILSFPIGKKIIGKNFQTLEITFNKFQIQKEVGNRTVEYSRFIYKIELKQN